MNHHFQNISQLPKKLTVLGLSSLVASLVVMSMYLNNPTSFQSSAQLAPGPGGANFGSCINQACTSDTDCFSKCKSDKICTDASQTQCFAFKCDTTSKTCQVGGPVAGGGGGTLPTTAPVAPTAIPAVTNSPIGRFVMTDMKYSPLTFTPPKAVVCVEGVACSDNNLMNPASNILPFMIGASSVNKSPYPNGNFVCFDATSDQEYGDFLALAKNAGNQYCATKSGPSGGSGGGAPVGGFCKNTNSCPSKSSGDSNCDGIINLADFEAFRRDVSGQNGSNCTSDYDSSSRVDQLDYLIWYRTIQGF